MILRSRFLILNTCLISMLVMGSFNVFAAPAPKKQFKVVIDPGHGGADLGTVFERGNVRIAEKDVTLALARETAQQLRAQGVRAILTRATDRDIPLPSRTAVANKLGADVFLSIHMNSTALHASATNHDAEGVETFILNNTSDASSRRLAHLENSVLGGGATTETPEQLDVALIIKDLRLDANLAESKRLACAVQRGLVSSTARDRGVKQALFHVLLGADMPSALVEVGFLSNPRDRQLVLSTAGQKSIGHAIARSILQFIRNRDTAQAAIDLARCRVGAG